MEQFLAEDEPMPLTCAELVAKYGVDWADDYATEGFTEAERSQIETHFFGCTACGDAVRDANSFRATMRAGLAMHPEIPQLTTENTAIAHSILRSKLFWAVVTCSALALGTKLAHLW